MKRFLSVLGGMVLLTFLSVCASQSSAQGGQTSLTLKKLDLLTLGYGQGTVIDQERYDAAPEAGDGLRGRGRQPVTLPVSFSLKEYTPIPGEQGDLGSCFAWASAYAARTIMEAQHLERTDKFLNTRMAFSPLHLYLAVREYSGAPADRDGGTIDDTVRVMAALGTPRKSAFDEKLVSNAISQADIGELTTNPITGFGRLFSSNASAKYRVDQVKDNLCEGKPVIIAIMVPPSFFGAKDRWVPEAGETADPKNGHALCVIGYDDNKYGGAFEIMNSWGEDWGNRGFTWIGYDDFGKWVEQAWVITEDPSAYSSAVEFKGKLGVNAQGKTGKLPVRLSEDGVYRLPSTLKDGTRIRVNPENIRTPDDMYTYIFCTYAGNGKAVRVAAGEWIRSDGEATPENIVVLYSRARLDIDSLLGAFEKQQGSASERVAKVIGKDFIPFVNAKYEYASMEITADFMNEKAVAGMILAVKFDAAEKPDTGMIRVKGGAFTMGSPKSERWREEDERQRKLTLADYYIGAAEVTVGEFREFVQSTGYRTVAEKAGKSMVFNLRTGETEERPGLYWDNPVFTQEETHPVVHLSWYDAAEYCNWRSRQEGLDPVYTVSGTSVRVNVRANGYRLPTEAEWEYACRAGTTTPFNTGSGISAIQANYAESLILKSTPVKKYGPNQWGLYDTHGNVLEWCHDAVKDDIHSVRSGTWLSRPPVIRSAYRTFAKAGTTAVFLGFRLARSAD